MFGKKACELLKEVANVDASNLPPYNDEGLQQVRNAVAEHHNLMSQVFQEVQQMQQQQEEQGLGTDGDDWANLHREACTVLVHHDSILRNKRVLMAYMYKRLCCVKEMWWRSRNPTDEFKAQLGPPEVEFLEKYDKLMNSYMGHRNGIGLSLTVDMDPPKDPSVQVRCVRDHGSVVFSIGSVNLAKDTAHLLPREEAEPFISSGVLVYM